MEVSTQVLLLLWFQSILYTSQHEVAVIFGGINNKESDLPSVEIFTSHLDNSCANDLSVNSEEVGHLFAYDGAMQKMAGLYLDNFGVFLCGGVRGSSGIANCSLDEYNKKMELDKV